LINRRGRSSGSFNEWFADDAATERRTAIRDNFLPVGGAEFCDAAAQFKARKKSRRLEMG
jgi:hypothetical protein